MPTRPQALLLFSDVFSHGGIQRFNRTLLSAVDALGMRCQVLSLHDIPGQNAESASVARGAVRGFAGSRSGFASAVLLAIGRRRYDWILVGHINFLSLAASANMARLAARSRIALIAHGIEVWRGIGPLRRAALGCLDAVLCVSEYTRRRILEQAPALEPSRLRVFPNALADGFNDSQPSAAARQAPERFILSVTRLARGDRYKGIVAVIEALSMLRDRELHYLVVGQGNDRDFLELVAARLGVGQRVHFLAGVDDADLASLYRRCAAFVLPSANEGFGIVYLEAMFFGAAVIAAAEKGALDVVRDGVTGLLVPFGDSLALARAIERVETDGALRERLRAGGLASVTGDGPFTYRRFVERTAAALALPAAGFARAL
jgi:phosphatidyl-myo-inositol dimannoside synthase